MKREAKFSDCGKYRYFLLREWDSMLPKIMCIGLNPSTANGVDDDPTIESLIRILTHNGFGGFYMTNLFAMISSNPEDLRSCLDPLAENDKWLSEVSERVTHILYCWGNFKMAAYRARAIRERFPYKKKLCLGRNANGSPKHPLFMRGNTDLILV